MQPDSASKRTGVSRKRVNEGTCVEEGGCISPAQGREKTDVEDRDTLKKTGTQ
jgi:hypothetical protein